MLPLYALAVLVLDVALALTWRLVERPRKISWNEPIGVRAPDRFSCSACDQLWSIPTRLRIPFIFRCTCGERMIVHLKCLPDV
jgi:hypothetical protein